ncbi:hypothetical protein Cadr_000022697 [Camelus dromedarius]|uniref:Uncharacterized protein n=1 Tax=Camelus dromedarius TaxID=9838 RepID=A0A5N4CGS1_CAMDR|nr:hypothetical protein Cadr_000022697 [Camelus dromedarius]
MNIIFRVTERLTSSSGLTSLRSLHSPQLALGTARGCERARAGAAALHRSERPEPSDSRVDRKDQTKATQPAAPTERRPDVPGAAGSQKLGEEREEKDRE